MPDPTRDATTITGQTRLVAVLGDPVAQVRAPALLNRLFAARGVDIVVIPAHVRPDDLGTVVRGLQATANVVGLLVTVPHKVNVLRYADVRSAAAELAGGANALRRLDDGTWHADNFDGAGFVAGLVEAGHRPEGRHVVLVGAGGAGAAIAPALLGAGVDRLTLSDVDDTRVKEVAERLSPHWPGRIFTGTGLESADIVVNATPLGMGPDDPLPFDPAESRPGALVADIVMKPRETRLLREAAGLGRPVLPGEPMLRNQMDLYLGYFAPGA
ncbi:shikimate dehydrogenase [Longispora fulva]|uniref:Shikimate dehydrogenase n=1 Tax=Longispora fulva TaxID=619741 RepID=A0A8J7GYD8_9ACTN|nr:shikimate dehydrogenase [Longispora fulva]MBG6141554.1 shikimate dehydrogenase [Longispora fulva]GIG59293.1 shikimate dehydrogenase [Longispora fulva]